MKRIQLIPLLSAVALLSACTVVPGTNLSTSGKTEVATGSVDVDQLADVYPVTPALISQLRKAPVVGKANPELNSEISRYEYRIGVGDILNVTVWDHPELTIPAFFKIVVAQSCFKQPLFAPARVSRAAPDLASRHR
ncbi:polysaccharide biosynthesis/export family protein [Aeromonas hydrophila]|uniref:polysaccharide biosynthesis/export family protein n=1 Tax=Aeromonas hydrophila TaxID=644 RepID=UPI0021CB942A|nr:polysaccharide biosynthesis/export family protein [Aeromonas hydrophila]